MASSIIEIPLQLGENEIMTDKHRAFLYRNSVYLILYILKSSTAINKFPDLNKFIVDAIVNILISAEFSYWQFLVRPI